MGGFPVEIVLSLLGLVVATATFLREFVFVGRKRLGYRVQMNTPASRVQLTDANGAAPVADPAAQAAVPAATPDPAAPDAATPTPDPVSVVLIRIENYGTAVIESGDYDVDDTPRLLFSRHKIRALEVTERISRRGESLAVLNDGLRELAPSVGADNTSRIVLPKERLERGEHYKLLVVLEGPAPDPLDANAKKVVDRAGSLKGGQFVVTTSRSRREPALLGLSVFLALVVMVQLLATVLRGDPPPRDCAAGSLTVVGSTAMAPMIRKAAQNYEKTCTDAHFTFAFNGTEPGLRTLTTAGPTQETLAIGDGSKGTSFAALTEIPLARASFSIVTHPGVGLKDLTTQQIRDLYRGNIRNWNEIGGPDLPVVLIDRTAGSGTRRALEARLLEDNRKVFRYASCVGMAPGGEQCEVDVTEEVVTFVAKIPGAVGYLETSAATDAVAPVSIDGVQPTQDTIRLGYYRFTGIEYAYTHGPVAGDSLVAQFLDYLIRGKARLTMIEFGNIPCVDPVEPKFCTP
ncbi:phosphate-binding protein [Nocardia neocaledoniensis NBRC 108232]|uniref:Phosphate ABC transporter substrate-binding protein (PhoT family) n=1 Tax=Nocardia neocaledoniensis TaxID=236511 RepID=A0A317P192_9NOCA|nr:substrate-binding domain-containing protein [Nocardia neocaledoniensis]PWV81389.1 phosphate ABC transporter substrate-binding protein (PhoT family) [Nocardia neocaledoniensis]GEM32934.1 phosphate-binding protein [Nocardia neocaledoniensis NBRC 108232]